MLFDMNIAANIVATSSTDMVRASFMLAKSHGTINPIALGAKLAMVAELKKTPVQGGNRGV